VVLRSVVLSNDIKDQREHEHQNGEENHEHYKVSHNVLHHCDNVTKGLKYSHVEKLLQETSNNCEDHNDLSVEVNCISVPLLDDTGVAESYLQKVDVVSNGSKISKPDLPHSASIMVNWVKETSTKTSQ
jgi:aspartate-semialdehyde dehydrogenase